LASFFTAETRSAFDRREPVHITYRDANGNGMPDEGEITANVDRFFFTCG
jgi:hypothetical protein